MVSHFRGWENPAVGLWELTSSSVPEAAQSMAQVWRSAVFSPQVPRSEHLGLGKPKFQALTQVKLQAQLHLQLHLPIVLPVFSAHSQLGTLFPHQRRHLALLITLLSTLASPPPQCLCFGADVHHFCFVPWEHSPTGSLCLLFWPVQHSISEGLCFKMFYPHFRKLLWILIACTQCTPQTWKYLRIHRDSLWLAYVNYVIMGFIMIFHTFTWNFNLTHPHFPFLSPSFSRWSLSSSQWVSLYSHVFVCDPVNFIR